MCDGDLERVYALQRTPEFKSFYDPTYGCEITSRSQEKRLMKQHGHIEANGLFAQKYAAQIKEARWKRNHGYSIYGSKHRKVV